MVGRTEHKVGRKDHDPQSAEIHRDVNHMGSVSDYREMYGDLAQPGGNRS